METWFVNHVLGLSLSVLLLGLPGPLGAETPSSNSTDSVTAGFHYSSATDELSGMGNNATSTSSSSESLSPSQRNILLTHTAAAGNFGKITVTEACSGKCSLTDCAYFNWLHLPPLSRPSLFSYKRPLFMSTPLKRAIAGGHNRNPADISTACVE